MKRFISAVFAFMFLCHAFVPRIGIKTVAAQDIQQSQSSDTATVAPEKRVPLQIPDGTVIDIEAPYTVNSMQFKANDKISFRVVNPIKIQGVTVIEQGATATGHIERSKRGGHWGRAGLLVWTMQTVTAIDGSQVPLRNTQVRLRGDSKGAKVATQMIITGAIMPLIAPVALLHGFKRGKDAYIPAGKRYSVFIDGNPSVVTGPTSVNGSIPPGTH